jgi:hypothetical protein
MNPFSPSYLPLRSPSYFESPVFWLASGVAVILIVGITTLVYRVDKKKVVLGAVSYSILLGTTPVRSADRKGVYMFMVVVLASLAYLSVTLVMDSIPAYSSAHYKVNENVKAKYQITEADIEVPEGVRTLVVDPVTGNTLTRINATVVQDDRVLFIPYHVSIDGVTGEPTLKSVIDSPAFSISPETLLIK